MKYNSKRVLVFLFLEDLKEKSNQGDNTHFSLHFVTLFTRNYDSDSDDNILLLMFKFSQFEIAIQRCEG